MQTLPKAVLITKLGLARSRADRLEEQFLAGKDDVFPAYSKALNDVKKYEALVA